MLTVVFYYGYLWLDERGFLDPIKARLPTFQIPFTSYTFNGKGGVYGSGGYKSVGAPAAAAAAAPMASSAYGST